MLPAKLNLTMKQGSRFEKYFQWRDKDGDPYDLTDWSARMEVKESAEHTDNIMELTTSNWITITPASGLITIEIAKNNLDIYISDKPFELAVYDLVLSNQGGQYFCIAEGTIRLIKKVTD